MQDARSSLSSSLPPEVPACHALITELSTAIVDLKSAQDKLSQENVELNLTIQKLLAQLRGHRRERHEDPAQQTMAR
jgi:regulator of replication initiation timing